MLLKKGPPFDFVDLRLVKRLPQSGPYKHQFYANGLKENHSLSHVIMIGGKVSWASSLPNHRKSIGLSQAINIAGIMSHLDAKV